MNTALFITWLSVAVIAAPCLWVYFTRNEPTPYSRDDFVQSVVWSMIYALMWPFIFVVIPFWLMWKVYERRVYR